MRGHLGKLARALYSNPPAFGARVVDAVLADPELEARWRECLVVMSGRIADMRAKLRSALEARTARDWFVHCVGIFTRLLDGVEVPTPSTWLSRGSLGRAVVTEPSHAHHHAVELERVYSTA